MRAARSAILLVLCVALPLAGCQTMNPVPLISGEPPGARFSPNDSVRVWTHDGRTQDLVLTAVDADALVSGKQRVPFREIDRIERSEVNGMRTALLVVAIGVVVFVIVVLTSGPLHVL